MFEKSNILKLDVYEKEHFINTHELYKCSKRLFLLSSTLLSSLVVQSSFAELQECISQKLKNKKLLCFETDAISKEARTTPRTWASHLDLDQETNILLRKSLAHFEMFLDVAQDSESYASFSNNIRDSISNRLDCFIHKDFEKPVLGELKESGYSAKVQKLHLSRTTETSGYLDEIDSHTESILDALSFEGGIEYLQDILRSNLEVNKYVYAKNNSLMAQDEHIMNVEENLSIVSGAINKLVVLGLVFDTMKRDVSPKTFSHHLYASLEKQRQ